jgi:dihydrofolate reductase
MRKLIVTNIMSLDGYYEGPGEDVMALPMDPFFDAHNAERLRAADTLLLGRRSYEGFQSFWPDIVHDPEAHEVLREISRRNNDIRKVVVSDSLTLDGSGPWHKSTEVVRRADAHRRIGELKREPGRDILMFGSRTVWSDLFHHGLVDELHLMVGAKVLGGGTALFAGRPAAELRLLDTRRVEDSSNLLVRYAVGGVPVRAL